VRFKSLKALVADAVAVELVSTPEFPANREKNREFFDSGAVSKFYVLVSPIVSGG
jgi:hypothetical protein